MKRILLGAAAMLIGLSVQAQESLFPELKGNAAAPAPAEQPEPSLNSPAAALNQPAAGSLNQPATATLNQPAGQSQQNQAAGEQKAGASGNIIIKISDVKIVVPPVEKMQFCRGAFTLENQTKDTLTYLEIEMDYQPVKMPYRFGGVPAGGSVRGTFGLAGPGCQSLMKSAPLRVKECQIGTWTTEDCQARVKYQMPE